ncbi:MAG TPA: CAP domain-containing protein [Stenomitos sp.]
MAFSSLVRSLLVSSTVLCLIPISVQTVLNRPGWAVPINQTPVALAPQRAGWQAIQQFALDLANRDRMAQGLAPMEIDPLLAEAAQAHANDMLRRNYFDHYSPEGVSPADRLAALGRQAFPAENIAMREGLGSRRIQASVLERFQQQWMASPSHRRNLMNPNYVRFGYGVAFDPSSGRIFAVQLFTRRS